MVSKEEIEFYDDERYMRMKFNKFKLVYFLIDHARPVTCLLISSNVELAIEKGQILCMACLEKKRSKKD